MTFRPNYVPLTISANSAGEVEVKVEGKVQTPIGTFELTQEVSLPEVERRHPGSLVLGVQNRAQVFELQKGVNYRPLLASSAPFNLKGLRENRASNTTTVALERVAPSLEPLLLRRRPVQAAPAIPPTLRQPIAPDQRSQIRTFIVEADNVQIQAMLMNNALFAASHFAGTAYDAIRQGVQSVSARGERLEMQLDSDRSRIQDIRFLPAQSQIEVDAVEVWTNTYYSAQSGQLLRAEPPKAEPQTMTIQQSPRGWYIVAVKPL